MLEKEFHYYLEHKDDLVKQYEGKYLVIKDEKVVGAYNSEIEAYTEAQKQFALGMFLIQPCTPSEESHTQTFHSRVAFG